MTEKGKQAYGAAMQLQTPWINGLAKGLAVEDIKTMHKVIAALRVKLDEDGDAD